MLCLVAMTVCAMVAFMLAGVQVVEPNAHSGSPVLVAVTVIWYVVSRMPAQSPGTPSVNDRCVSCSGASLSGAAGTKVGIAPMVVHAPCTRFGTLRNGQPAPPIVVRPQPA